MTIETLACRWHAWAWLGCNYCRQHHSQQIPKCDPSSPCAICDQSHLFDDAGAVTLGKALLYGLAAIGMLIVVPILLLIALAILGAPA